jgi:hypothetical protein
MNEVWKGKSTFFTPSNLLGRRTGGTCMQSQSKAASNVAWGTASMAAWMSIFWKPWLTRPSYTSAKSSADALFACVVVATGVSAACKHTVGSYWTAANRVAAQKIG